MEVEMETFMDYFIMALFGLIGIGMHILMKWRDVVTKNFDSKEIDSEASPIEMKWKLHIINGGMAVLVITILLLLGNKVNDFFPITEVTMLMAGYAADSIWKNFTKQSLSKMNV
jgi:hypothetical protein